MSWVWCRFWGFNLVFKGQPFCKADLNRGWLWIMTWRRLIWSWLDLVLSNLIIQIIQITKDQIKSFKSTFGGNSDRRRHAMVRSRDHLKKHTRADHNDDHCAQIIIMIIARRSWLWSSRADHDHDNRQLKQMKNESFAMWNAYFVSECEVLCFSSWQSFVFS